MSATVRAGERGVDFSFARPPAARLLELSYTFAVGYISVPPASPAKNITKAQCEAYVNAGVKLLLVWEMTAARASLGAAYGALDGADARRLATEIGYPQDVPILIACDTNTTALNNAAHRAYMFAAWGALAPYTIGEYADCDLLEATAGIWRIGWVPNAWSWSAASRSKADARAKAIGAHCLQRGGFYIDNTWAVDPNEAIADFPAWGHDDPTPPTPIPGDPDMADTYFSVETLPGEYLLRAGCDPVPFASAADRDALVVGMQLVSAGHLSLEMYQRLFRPALAVNVTVPPIQIPPMPTHFTGTIT